MGPAAVPQSLGRSREGIFSRKEVEYDSLDFSTLKSK